MKTERKKSIKFYKKIGKKYYIPALIFLLAGIFYFSPAKGIVTGKLMARGNYYFNGGAYNLDKAAGYYKAASFFDRKASYPHYQLARVFFGKGDFKTARAEIDTALALNPENKRAYYIRGLIDGYAKNYKAAEDDFQKFIAWAPGEWAGYNDLAWAYHEDKDYQNAVDAAKKGLEQFPYNPWLLNGLGAAYLGLGDKDNAKTALEKARGLADKMTVSDWTLAYPGNDPASAPWYLANFKTEVSSNLSSAGNQLAAASPGIFQSACSSTTVKYCSGSSCVSTDCAPLPSGLNGCTLSSIYNVMTDTYDPVCSGGTDCIITNCFTGGEPNYTPCCFSHNHDSYLYDAIKYCGNLIPGYPSSYKSCSTNADCLYCGNGVCDGGETCSTCPGDCGVCPANQNPTVSIVNPPDGSTNQSSSAINFTANASDPDGDPMTYTSTIDCGGSTLDSRSGSVSGGQVSFIFGSFSYGASCSWNITVNDGKGGTGSATSNFQIEATSSCSVSCSPGSLLVSPGGAAVSFSASCSGGCSSFVVNSCSRTSDTSGDKIHVGSLSGNSCPVTADADASYGTTATANLSTSCGSCSPDVNITVRRIGWIEVP